MAIEFRGGQQVPAGTIGRKKKRGRRAWETKNALLENWRSSQPVPLTELAERLGVTPGYLAVLSTALRKEEKIPRGRQSYSNPRVVERIVEVEKRVEVPVDRVVEVEKVVERRVPVEVPVIMPAPESLRVVAKEAVAEARLDKLLHRLSSVKPMTEMERRQLLTRLAQRGQDSIRVQAVKALEDMERVRGTQVGPPPPTDQGEERDRLVMLMGMVGKDQAVLAMAEAYPEVEVR